MRKGISCLVVLFLVLSQFVLIRPAVALSAADVTVDPPIAGREAEYDIEFDLGSNAAHEVPATTGYIRITFPAGTTVPTTINRTHVTINGTATPSNPVVQGTAVRIMVPAALAPGSTVQVFFAVDAGIKNPTTTTGNLRLQVETGYLVGTTQTVIESAVQSNTYFIGSPATVTPAQNTDHSTFVEYRIVWKLGNEGALSRNTGTITLTFPSDFDTPQGCFNNAIPASYITVNNTRLNSSATCTKAAAGDPLVISFKTPLDLSNNATVTVILTNQAGIKNPEAGDYTIDVHTSREPTPIESDTFTIVNAIEFLDLDPGKAGVQGVMVNPPVTSTEAEYQIRIKNDIPLSVNVGTITLVFPTGTTLPANIPASSVSFQMGDPTDDPEDHDPPVPLTFNPNRSGNNIVITVPIDIPANTSIIITFNRSLNIRNPGTAGIYYMQAMTSSQPHFRVSPPYAIGTAVTNVKVTPSPDTGGSTNVQYVVEFRLGANGALKANEDKIIILLNVDNPAFGSIIPAASVLVGNDRTIISTQVQDADSAPDSMANYTRFIVTPPRDIAANQTVRVTFLASAGLQNPDPESLRGYVRTNKEPILMDSPYYLIVDAVIIDAVEVTPHAANVEAVYTIDITIGQPLTKDMDTITVAFPMGTTVPNNITSGNITINGTALSFAPTVSQRNVTFRVPQNYTAGTALEIIFTAGAKVRNPTTAGLYTLQVMTSMQPHYRVSPPYAIGTSVTNVKVIPTPDTAGTGNTQYVVEFRLGANGALSANTDKIFITLRVDAPVPPGDLPPASVLVGTDRTVVSTTYVTSAAPEPLGKVTFTVTPPRDIAANQTVRVTFLASAGLRNPDFGHYRGYVRTSSEPISMQSPIYLITDAVEVGAITVNPHSVNSEAVYTIPITIGRALTKDIDTITVAFPMGNTVPTNITPGSITINGVSLNFAPTVSQRNVTFRVPEDYNAADNLVIVFTSGAKVRNPTTAGLYTLQVMTSMQPNYRVSPPYGIGTAVSAVKVTPNPSTKFSEDVEYVVEFRLGANGALQGNADDKIYITLPVSAPDPGVTTTIPGSSVRVGNDICTTDIQVIAPSPADPGPPMVPADIDYFPDFPGIYVRFVVTPPRDITANQTVRVTFLGSAGLANPDAGNWRGYVRTNQEPILVRSDFYLIADAIDINSVEVHPKAVSVEASYDIEFEIGTNLNQNTGTITVAFPQGTTVPTTLPVSAVQINGTNLTVNPQVSGTRVTITTPVNLTAGPAITLSFNLSAGIRNPTQAGLYTLQMMTSAQPYFRTSPRYHIGTTVTAIKVTPMPNTMNEENVEYHVEFRSGAVTLRANQDKILIWLPLGGVSPSPLSPGVIRVNDTLTILSTPHIIENINGDPYYKFEITVPVEIRPNSNVKVEFFTSCAFVNPGVEGIYRGHVATSLEPERMTSELYSIVDAVRFPGFDSPADLRSVLPRPNAINLRAQYLIAFQTTAGKPSIQANTGTITFTFPEDTKLPGTMSPGAIYIATDPFWDNVDPAKPDTPDAVTCSNLAAGTTTVSQPIAISGREITIRPPMTITGGQTVYVLFCETANIENPSTSGLYTMKIKTSSQPNNGVSRPYLIRSTISKPVVTPVPAVTEEPAEYTIRFKTGEHGALTRNADRIFIGFNADDFTSLTADLAPSVIRVNGIYTTTWNIVRDNQTALPANVDNAPGWNNYTWIEIQTPVDVEAGGEVTIEIMESAGLENPAQAGNHTLIAWTNKEPISIQSQIFVLGDALREVRVPVSHPNPRTAGSVAEYEINFKLGASGISALQQNVSTITVTFPEGTILPGSINPANITICSGAGCIPTTSVLPPVTISGRSVRFVVPINIAADEEVTVRFAKGANISNPETPGSYRLKVRTSSQPIDAHSNYYTILSTSGIPRVKVEPPVIDQENVEYTIEFQTGQDGSLSAGIGKITIFFEPDHVGFDANIDPFTELITAIPPNSIYVNDTPITTIPTRVNTAGNLTYIEFTTPINIESNEMIKVVIKGIAGIQNPGIPGAYRLAVQTTSEPNPVESLDFSLFSSIVRPIIVELHHDLNDHTIIPPVPQPRANTPNATPGILIQFNTGPAGNLIKDIGTFSIEFPEDTYVPLNIPASSIRVNGTTLTVAPVVDIEKRLLTLRVPNSIAANVPVEITISRLAGIRNPTKPGDYTLHLFSSSEPYPVRSEEYSLVGLSAAIVEVDPCLYDSARAQYDIYFQNTNEIAKEEKIIIDFPYGTRLPSVIQGSHVLVNGRPANVGDFPQVAVVEQRVTITVPETIPGLSNIHIVFLPDARVTNPPAGSYMLRIRADTTGPDRRYVDSHPYDICQLINISSVEITPQNVTLEKGGTRTFTATVKDDQGNEVRSGLQLMWTTEGGIGTVSPTNTRTVTFTAGQEPRSGQLKVQVTAYGTPTPVIASTNITIAPDLASVSISPTSATVQTGRTQVFSATVRDELGGTLNIEVEWSISGAIGSISPVMGRSTTFTASSTEGTGQIRARATFGGITREATASITVTEEAAPPPPPPPPPPDDDEQPFTVVADPNTLRTGQTGINISFTITALVTIERGSFLITVPEAFPEPRTQQNVAGSIEVRPGSGTEITAAPSVDDRTITVPVNKMSRGQTFTLSYSRINAPDRPGEYTFNARGKATEIGAMVDIKEPPRITVVSAADGAGRATIQPNEASAGSIGQRFTITYVADAVMDGGSIAITIPDGWSRPSLSETATGFVRIGPETTGEVGEPEIAGYEITISVNRLEVNQRISLIYSNVDVPNVPNTYSFLVKSRGMGGILKPIVLNPSVKVENTRISDGRVEVTPNMTNTPAEYSLTFRTSTSGFLPRDRGKITFVFPAEATLPREISSDHVTVGGVKVNQALEVDAIRSTVTLIVPEDVPANSLVLVRFALEANITNPRTAKDDYRIMISTSSDSIPTGTSNFRIVVSLLRNVKVTVSPIVPGATAAYTIQFMVGGAGALNVHQDTVTMVFPSDTVLPATIAANSIMVNGTALQVRPQIDIAQRKLTFSMPVRAENDANVEVGILASANVKNPTRDGMYRLRISTSKETDPVESEPYQIGTSLLGDVRVSLSSSIVEATNVTYTISFRTGAYGALSVGDTISITFDRRYRLTSIPAHQVSVNGVVLSVTPEIKEGHTLVINTPIGISSESNVTLAVSGIINPSDSGEYTLSLATQAEPMPVVSTPYRIGMILETKITVMPESPNGLAGWYTLAPNIMFTNDVSNARIFYAWDDGNFQRYTGESIRAPEGIHELSWYSTAENFEDEPRQHMQFKVDTRPPVVMVIRPTEGFVSPTPNIQVEGEVDEANTFSVMVNDRPATVTNNRFSITITLNPGDNWIDIVATDQAGNRSVTPRIRVTYRAPAEIRFNITAPRSLSNIFPELKPTELAGSYQLTAPLRVTGSIEPTNARVLNVIILGKMEAPKTLAIAEDGTFDGVVDLPVTAGLNGITFSVKDEATGRDYTTSVAVIAKVTVVLQIGNALAFMNDKEYRLDAPPYIKNARTMLPMRFIGESFGARIGWDPEKRMVSYALDNIVIELVIGNTTAVVRRGDQRQEHTLDVAPEIVAGRTFVPVRFVSEQLGAEIEWEPTEKKVIIEK